VRLSLLGHNRAKSFGSGADLLTNGPSASTKDGHSVTLTEDTYWVLYVIAHQDDAMMGRNGYRHRTSP
jgi:hypothetical protein